MEKKGIVIAMGNRAENLAKFMEKEYCEQGYQVYRSEAKTKKEVEDFYNKIEQENADVRVCIYFASPLKEMSLFDDDILLEVEKMIEDGLANGTWWLQQTCDYLKRTDKKGSVIIMDHAPSVVPDVKYSYCCIPEAALANIGRVAAMDTHGNTDVNINFVTCGWRASEPAEADWKKEMDEMYGGAKAPILECITDREIADACLLAATFPGTNGNNFFVDKGYCISRTIRQRKQA